MDFPVAEPVREALAHALELSDLGYANPKAIGLGEALAGFCERRFGLAVDPDQVTPLGDVVGGLAELVRALTEPGDGVVVNPPVYHPFFSLIEQEGRAWSVPARRRRARSGRDRPRLRRRRPCPDPLQPPQPDRRGAVAGRARRVAAIAAAHEAWVFADEIHAAMVLPGAEHTSFLGMSEAAAARGIVVTSASKAFNLAGLGCAQAITAGQPARAAVANCRGRPALRPFRSARKRRRLPLRRRVAGRRQRAPRREPRPARRAARRAPARGRLRAARRGLSGVARLPRARPGRRPSATFLERGRVALSPGPQFGPGGEGFARLNYATSPALLELIVERMASAVGR